jgi:hypothetical protein
VVQGCKAHQPAPAGHRGDRFKHRARGGLRLDAGMNQRTIEDAGLGFQSPYHFGKGPRSPNLKMFDLNQMARPR